MSSSTNPFRQTSDPVANFLAAVRRHRAARAEMGAAALEDIPALWTVALLLAEKDVERALRRMKWIVEEIRREANDRLAEVERLLGALTEISTEEQLRQVGLLEGEEVDPT